MRYVHKRFLAVLLVLLCLHGNVVFATTHSDPMASHSDEVQAAMPYRMVLHLENDEEPLEIEMLEVSDATLKGAYNRVDAREYAVQAQADIQVLDWPYNAESLDILPVQDELLQWYFSLYRAGDMSLALDGAADTELIRRLQGDLKEPGTTYLLECTQNTSTANTSLFLLVRFAPDEDAAPIPALADASTPGEATPADADLATALDPEPSPEPTSEATPEPTPTPAPDNFIRSEVEDIQYTLRMAGFYHGDKNGTLDAETLSAIQSYLRALYNDPTFERNMLTREEYHALKDDIKNVPAPTATPTATPEPTPTPSPTPAPEAIALVAPTMTDGGVHYALPLSDIRIQGQASTGYDVQLALGTEETTYAEHTATVDDDGRFEWSIDADTLAIVDGQGAVSVVAHYADTNIDPETLLTFTYQTARANNAVLSGAPTYSHRNTELRIAGTVHYDGTPAPMLTFLDERNNVVGNAEVEDTGAFLAILPNGLSMKKLYLQFREDTERLELLTPTDIAQETLLPFTRSLSTQAVTLAMILLFLFSAVLLFAYVFSRHIHKKPRKSSSGTTSKGSGQRG